MKKLLSVILALMMVMSVSAFAVSAEVLYEDSFDGDDFNWDFWDGIGKFVVENGKMSGWEDAKIGQSRYIWEPGKEGITTTDEWPCQREFTQWIDINVDEGGVGEQGVEAGGIQHQVDAALQAGAQQCVQCPADASRRPGAGWQRVICQYVILSAAKDLLPHDIRKPRRSLIQYPHLLRRRALLRGEDLRCAAGPAEGRVHVAGGGETRRREGRVHGAAVDGRDAAQRRAAARQNLP